MGRGAALAKLSLKLAEPGRMPSSSAMFVKLMSLLVMSAALIGVIYMLLNYSWQDQRQSWDWEPEKIRTNFDPLLTTEQIRELFEKKRQEWFTKNPINQIPVETGEQEDPRKVNQPAGNRVATPFGNDDSPAPPPPDPYSPGVDQREEVRRDADHELKLAEKLTLPPVFELLDETQN